MESEQRLEHENAPLHQHGLENDFVTERASCGGAALEVTVDGGNHSKALRMDASHLPEQFVCK